MNVLSTFCITQWRSRSVTNPLIDISRHWRTRLARVTKLSPAARLGLKAITISAVFAMQVIPAFSQRNVFNKSTLAETSFVAPALRFANCKLYIAWTGTDYRLNISSSSDGIHFSNKRTFDEYSYFSPALAASSTGQIYLAWTGTDNRLNIMSSTDGVNFGNKITLQETSFWGPALAAGGTRSSSYLAIGWTGTDNENHLNVDISRNGSRIFSRMSFSDTSQAGPALADFQGTLYIAWTDRGRIKLGKPGAGYYGPTISTQTTLPLPESSYDTPALASVMDYAGTTSYTPRLYVGWTGTDDSMSVNASANPSAFSDRVRVTLIGDISWYGNGPALEKDAVCTSGYFSSPEGAYIAWTGADSAHHLNVARIHAVDFAWR